MGSRGPPKVKAHNWEDGAFIMSVLAKAPTTSMESLLHSY